MSNYVRIALPYLTLLCHKTCNYILYSAIIKQSPPEFLKCILEISTNILLGIIPRISTTKFMKFNEKYLKQFAKKGNIRSKSVLLKRSIIKRKNQKFWIDLIKKTLPILKNAHKKEISSSSSDE